MQLRHVADKVSRSPGGCLPQHPNTARLWIQEANQQPNERGFSSTVGAEQSEADTTGHLQRQIIERLYATVVERYPFNFNNWSG